MGIAIIDCGSITTEDVGSTLSELGYEYNILSMAQLPLTNMKGYSGLIISGSPFNTTELKLPRFLDRFSFIKDVTVPVLGICFGHQVIGLVYGSKVTHKNMILKKTNITVVRDNMLFEDIDNKSAFMERHEEHITLPPSFIRLATSKDTNIEAMKHKEKDIYGVQFHPESSGDNGKTLLQNFCNMCTATSGNNNGTQKDLINTVLSYFT